MQIFAFFSFIFIFIFQMGLGKIQETTNQLSLALEYLISLVVKQSSTITLASHLSVGSAHIL